MIRYNPADDSLYIKDNRKNPELSSKQMFCLPIAKEEIYKRYAFIIDCNLNKKEKLESKENNQSKVLRKTL